MTFAQVDAAARAYGLERETLIPERAPLRVDFTERTIGVGELEVALRGDTPDEVMADYLRVIRTVRGLRAGAFMTLRDEDLAILSDVLSHDPETIEERLVELMGLSHAEAAELRRMLLKKRALAPAAGLVLGVAVFTSAAAPQPAASDNGSAGEAVVDHGAATMHVSAVEQAPQHIGDDAGTMVVYSTASTPAPAPSGQSSPQVSTGPSEVLSSDTSPDLADVSDPEVPTDEMPAPEVLLDVEIPPEPQEGWTPPPVVTLPDSWEEPEHVEEKLPSALDPGLSEESGRSGSDGATGIPGGSDLDPVDDDSGDDDSGDDDSGDDDSGDDDPVDDDSGDDDSGDDDSGDDDSGDDDSGDDDSGDDDSGDDDSGDDDSGDDDSGDDDSGDDDSGDDDSGDDDSGDDDSGDDDSGDDDSGDDDSGDDDSGDEGPGQSGGSGGSGGKGGGASPGKGGGNN